MAKVYLSLIVPMYNEGGNIAKRYKQLSDWCRVHPLGCELIFSDDGSRDDTVKVLDRLSHSDKTVTIIQGGRNRGRGGAVRSGFKVAKGDLVGYIDSDLEITPKNISYCLKRLGRADGVVVSKHLAGSKVETPVFRRAASKLFNYWVRKVLSSKVTDHQAGLKIFRKSVIDSVLDLVKDDGWLFDVEFLYHAQKLGFSIVEVPIEIRYGYGKFRQSMVWDFLKSLIYVIKVRIGKN